MYIDTHCHLNFKDFKDEGDEIIKKTLENGVWMILVGSQYSTSERAVEYANKYSEGVYSAIGLHPIHLFNVLAENHDGNGDYKFISQAEEFDEEKYFSLAKENKKVVAIGEIGLDYFHLDKEVDINIQKDKQKEIFTKQLILAHNLNLPVIIHSRESHEDLLPLLTKFREEYKDNNEKEKEKEKEKEWGVVHCFSGDTKLAEEYIKLGLLVSFTGLITFSHNWDEVIKDIPLEKIMIETDSPYMAPIPVRGTRNEPVNVKYVAKKIAELKGTTEKEVEDITFENAKRLFKLV
jgi:TatD DNase family protein